MLVVVIFILKWMSRFEHPFLTVIIPAFNEERRLPLALEKAINFLEKQEYDYELIVVENGSQDSTFRIANDFAVSIHTNSGDTGNCSR